MKNVKDVNIKVIVVFVIMINSAGPNEKYVSGVPKIYISPILFWNINCRTNH